jgi:polyhydroxyalkanoate synthesis repressor PhaR
MLVKKYSNRRLYDTQESRYITLEELAAKVRSGQDVRVVDAKTEEDLTQATLTQIIIESRGAGRLLPVPLLMQLVRMGDDAFAEFLSRYMAAALELYLQAKQGAQAVAPYNPFATLPFTAGNELARLFSAGAWADAGRAAAPAPPSSEVAELRREVEGLKQAMRKKRK